MKRGICLLVTVVIMFIFVSVGIAAEKSLEHPLIRPFPGSELMPKPVFQDFAEFPFIVANPQTGKQEKKLVQGKFWKLTYRLFDSKGNWDGSHSILEYRQNYKEAALEQGGTILFEEGGYLTFTLPSDNGGKTWCQVHLWNKSQQDLRIIEEKGFKKSLTFGPKEMKAAIDKDDRVILYDILFDYDKATLLQSSSKQLQHVVTLLLDNPELKMEVQGHTDSKGGDEYNLELSQRRAETVVAYLRLFGIVEDRLRPKGYGETKPVASNDSEDGRAKNRRVELVRIKD